MSGKNTGTIDYALDLGTISSYIAKVENDEIYVIAIRLVDGNFTVSSYAINSKGEEVVGDKVRLKSPFESDNIFNDFKMAMDLKPRYTYDESDPSFTPGELSAEILNYLKNEVKSTFQKDLKSVVITIPDDYYLPQLNSIRKSAKDLGFEEVIFLRDSVAVATAYGIDSSTPDSEIWLIYNFGGGSFNASLYEKCPDEITALSSDGDEYLGGKLIDFDIVDKILAPEIEKRYNIPDFKRGNRKYANEFFKLRSAAEKAKIDLSYHMSVKIRIDNLLSDENIDFEYELTRDELTRIMDSYINRTINHCRNALKAENLTAEDVDKIILVGAPCLNGYVHERLTEEFNVPLEYSISPETAVIKGSAIYASLQNDSSVEFDDSKDAYLKLSYDPVDSDDEFEVMGILNNPKGDCSGYSVEFTNPENDYIEKADLDENGYFEIMLEAEEGDWNIYEITVYDQDNNQLDLVRDSINCIRYRIAPPVAKQIAHHSLQLGDDITILSKGTFLPYIKETTFKSPVPLRAGDSSKRIYLPLYEGNYDDVNLNVLVGYLSISGDEISEDLPECSEIEVMVEIDESMNIESSAYMASTGEEIYDVIRIVDNRTAVLKERFEKQKQRYMKLLQCSLQVINVEIKELFIRISESELISITEQLLDESPENLDDAAMNIDKLTNILDIIEGKFNERAVFDEIKDETDGFIQEIERNIGNATSKVKKSFRELKDSYSNASQSGNLDKMIEIKKKSEELSNEIHENRLLKELFSKLSKSEVVLNKDAAEKLIEEGKEAIKDEDMDRLRKIAYNLSLIVENQESNFSHNITDRSLKRHINRNSDNDTDDLQNKFENQKERYKKLLMQAEGIDEGEIREFFDRIDDENLISNIENFLKIAKQSAYAFISAKDNIATLTNILDSIENLLEFHRLKEDIDKKHHKIESAIDNASPLIQSSYSRLRARYDEIVEKRDSSILEEYLESLEYIMMDGPQRDFNFLVETFKDLSASGEFTDPDKADLLIKNGREAIDNEDIDELRRILHRLISMKK